MGKPPGIIILEFFRGELRTFLALVLLLLIFVGLGFAAGDSPITFDFGTGLSSEVAPGAISVAGGTSIYPRTTDGLTFGWKTPYIAEQSSGAQVSDLLETDSNQGVGDNTFTVSNLSSQYYTVTLISGNLTNAITTKVVVNGVNYVADSDPGVWKNLTFKAAAGDGNLAFDFKRYGNNLWAVNAIILVPSSTPPTEQTFDVNIQPGIHIVPAGGIALYRISVLSNNGYGSNVTLSVAGLPSGMTAAFSPVSGFPPFISNLAISTLKAASVTRYVLTLSAKGSDSQVHSVNKQLFLILTTGTAPPAVTVNSATRRQQAINYQKLADAYLLAEDDQLPSQSALDALQDLSDITNVKVLSELPRPRSLLDASLRQLTSAGIIDIVVDSAPAVASIPPPRIGFWAQFFGAMFNPVQ